MEKLNYGDGRGSGNGSGNGRGSGNGDGSGDGYGRGDGYGNGYGDQKLRIIDNQWGNMNNFERCEKEYLDRGERSDDDY